MNWENKYLKYKAKYLALKNQPAIMTGGSSSGSLPTVILAKAEWCGHCTRFKPVWNALKKKYNGKLKFVTYDSEADANMITKYNIQGFPTIMFQNGNGDPQEYQGSREESALETFFKTLI
jgi:thioredoxin-like negative regulator of GroEL